MVSTCPQCGAAEFGRERRPNGNSHCENGHSYPTPQGPAPAPAPVASINLLVAHAELTIAKLESMLKRRGSTTGKKAWEVELLKSAYLALGLEPTKHKPGSVW